MQQTGSGVWGNTTQLHTHPFVILNGEVAPEGVRTRERTFIIGVEKETSFKPGGHAEFVNITKSATFRYLIAYMVQRTSAVVKLEYNDDWSAYQRGIPEKGRELAIKEIAKRCVDTYQQMPRLLEVSSLFLSGIISFLTLGVTIEAWSQEEMNELMDKWMGIACRAIDTYYDRYLRLQDMSHGNIEKLKQIIASGGATLSDTARPGTPRIGKVVLRRDDGRKYVALIPDALRKVLKVSDAFAAVSDAVERFNGANSTYAAWIGGQAIRCFYIKSEYWTPNESSMEDGHDVDF